MLRLKALVGRSIARRHLNLSSITGASDGINPTKKKKRKEITITARLIKFQRDTINYLRLCLDWLGLGLRQWAKESE